MGFIKIPHGRSKPTKSALCKAPVQGIVVAKPPQPKPATPIIVTRIQERFGPLSAVAVPAIRKMVDPVQRFQQLTKHSHSLPKLPRKPKGPKARVLSPEDQALRLRLADELVSILRYRIKCASKMTLVYQWNGSLPMGAITGGLRLAVKRGDVFKDQSKTPSRYSIAKPIKTIASNEWITGPGAIVVGIPLTESGWTTQL